MVQREPSYCPRCGTALTTRTVEGRTRAYCPENELVVWRNAVPLACVVVTDGDRVLLVDAASKPGYNVPGGHPEYDEEPVVAALRELEEETGLRADPADAELLDVRHRDAPNGLHYWVTYFRVDRADTDGAVVAGSDARATAWFDESALEGDRPHPDAVQLSLPLLTQ